MTLQGQTVLPVLPGLAIFRVIGGNQRKKTPASKAVDYMK